MFAIVTAEQFPSSPKASALTHQVNVAHGEVDDVVDLEKVDSAVCPNGHRYLACGVVVQRLGYDVGS